MKKQEKEEIERLPAQYRPLSAWAYWGYSILFSIPIVGIILIVVFAFDNSNINRRSYARSFFCGIVLALIIAAAIIAFGGAAYLADTLTQNYVKL